MANQTKVLIVDDSALMRVMIRDVLSSEPAIEIQRAINGKNALEKMVQWSPDVVTLDVAMPKMGGLETLRKIMKQYPTRVIMLSGLDDPKTVFDALDLGAIDFIVKPTGKTSGIDKLREELLAKINMAMQVDITKMVTFRYRRANQIRRKEFGLGKKAIAIGASTGGPPALELIVRALPANFAYPVFVVQHLPPGFSDSLAKRLDSASRLRVKVGEHGEVIQNGVIYVAPGDFHMTVDMPKSNIVEIVRLDQEPRSNGVRPCVDRMMKSVAKVYAEGSVGVILTGMGRDGTEGFSAIKQSNGRTIAQNKESSVVFGMPAEVIKNGFVDKVASLENIAEETVKMITGEEG